MESATERNHSMMIEHTVPLNMQIDPTRARFPCCIVWTPLPVISWLLPFVGHIGIAREDGVILDFAGPNFVCVDNFTFGAVARYIQINKDKVFEYSPETIASSPNDSVWHYLDPNGKVQGPFSLIQLQRWSTTGYFPVDMRIWANHKDKSLLLNDVLRDQFSNYENVTATNKYAMYINEEGECQYTWDTALKKSTQEYQHREYNILTCNCHSFVANNLNRLELQGGGWNVVNVALLLLLKGQWVDKMSMVRAYAPFVSIFIAGVTFGGVNFLAFLVFFAFLLVGWYLLGTYCFKNLIKL